MTSLGWYGIAVGSILLIKLAMSIPIPGRRRIPRPFRHRGAEDLTIHAVITVYNEPADMLRRCLESLLAQTRLPLSVTVIDDCSRTHDAERVVRTVGPAFRDARVRLRLIRFPVNRGKRHGLAAGFAAQPDADIYLAVDSDTVLDHHAIARAAAPFARRRVQCVTGLVLAHNRSTNLLTRLIDMRYVNAFLGERVAYGRLGSVLCACGSLAMYRGWVVRKHLPDFLDQRFLGRPATFGDDRRLTYYCLLEGQSLIVPTAIGWTDVPERLGHYIRQQIRWGKSFIREGSLLVGQLRVTRAFWWLNLLELVTWVAFTTALIAALAVLVMHPQGWTILAGYAAYVCAMSWLRSVHYLRGAGNVPLWDRWGTFAAAPLYALLNLTLLLPLRLWSLATLRDTNWGTRQNGAELESTQVTVTRPAEQPAAVLSLPHPRHDDTVPILKLRDPHDDTTLQVALPIRTQ